MIRITSITIEEFRGIRALDLRFEGKNFAICGRNGTGKSGIVDAIEFVFTGSISRLSGEGSDKLSVKEHAPHVDSRNNPEKARVTIEATIPSLGKSVTITRSVAQAKTPLVSPPDADILAVLRQIEEHPELVLTRREIIRYILATEGNRAQEVQAVLKLDRLETVRSELKAIANGTAKEAKNAKQNADLAVQALARVARIPTLSESGLRTAINARRQLLNLPLLAGITAATSVKEGLAIASSPRQAPKLSKSAATQVLAGLNAGVARLTSVADDPDFIAALSACNALALEPDSVRLLATEDLLNTGNRLLDDDRCPLCDTKWELGALRQHLATKIAALAAIRARRDQAEVALRPCVVALSELSQSLETASRYGALTTPPVASDAIQAFRGSVAKAQRSLEALVPLDDTVGVLTSPPLLPEDAKLAIEAITRYVESLPEPSKEDEAREYLIVCQERLDAYRDAQRARKTSAARAALAAQVALAFSKTSDAALTELYRRVEKEFAAMYGELHAPDEEGFDAHLVPSLGKLGFDVDFYGKGFFPPGAYHSEGHQDAMGLCLYLALMSYVLKNDFTFAVLDDVLMSVDSGHRRAVCTLLKKRFPDTQFILTTHDPVWLNHMRTEGLISNQSLVRFHSWSVSTGPAFWSDVDVWSQIETELQSDRVAVAAELLRNYLEYISAELCHRLKARVEFRLDAQMELGQLLPPACSRLGDLLTIGKAAANAWGNAALRSVLTERHEALKEAKNATAIDQWQVNAAVHYNAWASLHKNDFRPLVGRYRTLVDQFHCPEPDCQAFVSVLRDGYEDVSVSCPCGKSTFGLRGKPAV